MCTNRRKKSNASLSYDKRGQKRNSADIMTCLLKVVLYFLSFPSFFVTPLNNTAPIIMTTTNTQTSGRTIGMIVVRDFAVKRDQDFFEVELRVAFFLSNLMTKVIHGIDIIVV